MCIVARFVVPGGVVVGGVLVASDTVVGPVAVFVFSRLPVGLSLFSTKVV